MEVEAAAMVSHLLLTVSLLPAVDTEGLEHQAVHRPQIRHMQEDHITLVVLPVYRVVSLMEVVVDMMAESMGLGLPEVEVVPAGGVETLQPPAVDLEAQVYPIL